ncbi:MAG: hypothetical protein QOI98_2318 [Solirubrobacteraceae bacterium]|jgi:uncharacterized membrane protein YeaQ/YmgE (transglycosylase-associated protein family)|nr:hypothetical protein [Solirubrobacteraceae bacterium]
MSLLLYLLLLPVIGLIVGALGRLALPGPDPMSVGQTIAIGLAGSLLAGLLGWILFGHDGGGLLLSVACSAGIVYLIRRSRGGSLTRPSAGS